MNLNLKLCDNVINETLKNSSKKNNGNVINAIHPDLNIKYNSVDIYAMINFSKSTPRINTPKIVMRFDEIY